MNVRNIIIACALVNGTFYEIPQNDSYFTTLEETKSMEHVYQDEFELDGKSHEINIYEKQSNYYENEEMGIDNIDVENSSQIEVIVVIDENTTKARTSANETWKYFNNALTMKFTVVFSVYSDGSSIANYYKLSSLSSSVVNISSGYTMDYINLFLFNNGVTRTGGGKTNQSKAKNVGGSLNGTLYGNSSWEPTYTWEEVTKAYAEFRIKKGSSKYENNWGRIFYS